VPALELLGAGTGPGRNLSREGLGGPTVLAALFLAIAGMLSSACKRLVSFCTDGLAAAGGTYLSCSNFHDNQLAQSQSLRKNYAHK
jgi:hypothetical protein